MAEEIYQLTKEGYDRLKKERDALKVKLMGEIADRIKDARELGDLSENSEYEEAKNEQGKIDSRIKEIDYILDHAEIIIETATSDEVRLGTKLKIYDFKLKKEREFMLVTPQEADLSENKLSSDSLIGKAVLGKKKGEIISIKTIKGQIKKIEIKDINL
ncbi:transcription elongation factor GreA [Oceanotoga sp. DSM 15011]|jgi:transcription elongation factor GreA|uniref:transcription elongation factor GreA n=1 Tax=unclassified Oceanotoga TaxID=2618448 RepID=UPI0021F48408|nr:MULTISPECIES: transcription elongation factor GreA [unclassified Oceanotoga]MDN5342357.1 transcription elongation factor GreA [Oceanotoga sp.]UYP00940.1 transcription elongation factor GreA [Oceanotoga sp. DSM 15011]